MKHAYRRRDYFIKKWFQTRFLLMYLLILLAGGGIFASRTYRQSQRLLRISLYSAHSTYAGTWEILRDKIVRANLDMCSTVLAAAVVLTVGYTWVVESAARRMRKNIGAYLRGDDPGSWRPIGRPVEFQRLQELLAAGLLAHQEQIAELRGRCADLERQARQLREEAARSNGAPSAAQLGELRANYHELQNRYHRFLLE